jgi:hypothetical protein
MIVHHNVESAVERQSQSVSHLFSSQWPGFLHVVGGLFLAGSLPRSRV